MSAEASLAYAKELNLDIAIHRFIADASDASFYARFASYTGDRARFDYNEYRWHLDEQQYRHTQLIDCALLSIRNLRRDYKMHLEHVSQQWTLHGTHANNHCLRCHLIARGVDLLPAFVWRAFRLALPNDRCITPVPTNRWAVVDNGDYATTLAISTACAAIGATRQPIGVDEPLAQMVRERRAQLPKRNVRYHHEHQCKRVAVDYLRKYICRTDNSTRFILRHTHPPNGVANVLIYAPPGFGKTTFQHVLRMKGICLVDLDDLPFADREDAERLLDLTSVLTNRMDFLYIEGVSKMAFVPASVEVLRKRSFGSALTDDDYLYWFAELAKLRVRDDILFVEVSDSYLVDWFQQIDD